MSVIARKVQKLWKLLPVPYTEVGPENSMFTAVTELLLLLFFSSSITAAYTYR